MSFSFGKALMVGAMAVSLVSCSAGAPSAAPTDAADASVEVVQTPEDVSESMEAYAYLSSGAPLSPVLHANKLSLECGVTTLADVARASADIDGADVTVSVYNATSGETTLHVSDDKSLSEVVRDSGITVGHGDIVTLVLDFTGFPDTLAWTASFAGTEDGAALADAVVYSANVSPCAVNTDAAGMLEYGSVVDEVGVVSVSGVGDEDFACGDATSASLVNTLFAAGYAGDVSDRPAHVSFDAKSSGGDLSQFVCDFDEDGALMSVGFMRTGHEA